jgi:carbon storage regulator CsrA
MLVLTLRDHESVRIGDVVVYVKRIQRGRVRLTIDADRSVRVVRSAAIEKEPQPQKQLKGGLG